MPTGPPSGSWGSGGGGPLGTVAPDRQPAATDELSSHIASAVSPGKLACHVMSCQRTQPIADLDPIAQ